MSDVEKKLTAKMILDDSGYSNTIKGINAELRNNKSELHAATTGLDAYGRTSENVKRVQDSLNKQLETQSRKLEVYKEAIKQSNAKMQESIAKREALGRSVKEEEQNLKRLERTYGENSKEVVDAKEKLEALKQEFDRTNASIENNARQIKHYENNVNKAEAGVNKATSSIKNFSTQVDTSSTKLGRASTNLKKFGEKASSIGGKLTLGVTLPLAAAGIASFKLASDLNENINKTSVVFKDNTKEIEKWSKTSLEKMGMSQSSALEMASKFGDMGTSMELSAQQTAEYSMNLTQLAADMASFKNISIERADTALTAVYTGETEALKGLGIVMTQNNLQAFAEEQGIHKKIKAMTQAEQVQLRYNYVMAKTRNAQGDFARTNTQAANASRTFKEATKELGATIGTELLPMITPLINKANDLIKYFASMDEGTRNLIVKLGIAAIATGPLLSGIGKMSSGVSALITVGSKLGGVLGSIGTASTIATTATTGMTVAAEGASVAVAGTSVATAGLGATLATVALPIVGVVAAIGAIGYAGYKTAKYLKEEATPSVDLFADKAVYSTQKIVTAQGTATKEIQTGTIKISEATKTAVQAYLDLDKNASNSLMDLQANSIKFTKETKTSVIKNFTDMSNKASSLSKEQKENMIVNFEKLVSDTGTLTKKSKSEIIKQYTEMVNSTKDLTKAQKEQTIKDFTDTLNKSISISKKQSDDLNKIYSDMATKIKSGMDKKNNDELNAQKEFFAKSNVLTATEEAKALAKTKDYWSNKKKTIDETQAKITEIIKKASDEHRNITTQEAQEIDKLQNQMKTSAIKALSENEVQSKVILERIKGASDHLTAEMVGNKIKELNKLRDSSVKAANDECDKRIAEAIRMRDETKSISSEQAEKLIADAKRQRDETVQAAEDTRNQTVNKIVSMNTDIGNNVNTTTGDMLTNWDRLKNWWSNWHPVDKILNIFTRKHGDDSSVGHNWTGNTHFKGGLTTLHERGEELYELPTGTKIYNHEMSEQMVLETARQTAQALIDSNNTSSRDDKEITIVVKSYLDNKIVAESTDKVLMKKRRLEGRMLGSV